MSAIITTLLILSAIYASCQTREETPDLQSLSDGLLALPDEDLPYEALYENAMQILSSPLDLNTATAEELKSLYVLTDEQIENFVSYRRALGPLLDVYELQVISGFDRAVILELLPFIRVIDPSTRLNKRLFRRMFSSGHSYLVMRYARTLERKKGFYSSAGTDAAFSGSPDKMYVRMRSSLPGDFSVGITGEKDEGERMRVDRDVRQWGFDFTSFHFQVRNKGKLENLILGDYQAQFAQGLMLGGAFGIGKGGENVSTIRKSVMGFQPYTSVHEAACQRGIAATINIFPFLDISAFYSNARRDANEGDSSATRSLVSTGLHRTANELRAMKQVKEQNAGVVLRFKRHNLEAGLLTNLVYFDASLKKRETLYNQFAFSGTNNVNTGLFLNYRWRNLSFFSEAARSLRGGTGGLAGLLVSAHTNLDVAILYRYYARNFYTFYANAISENTQAQNERAVYWSWRYRWNRRYGINGYVDLFRFPWLGFRRYAPSDGYEWLIRGNYRPSRDVNVFLQLREESKAANQSRPANLFSVAERVRRNVSLNFDYGVGQNIRLKSRIQYNSQEFDGAITEGWAFIQDISFSLGKFGFSGRHGLFDTDQYDNRHYVYERDAWSSYSFPAYSGVGVRNYALIEYNVNKGLTLWFRYARTRMLSVGEIGSGQDTIDGNTRNDIKFQARLTF